MRFHTLLMIILLSCYTIISEARVEEIYPFSTTSMSERFKTLTENIRCVVCQNQNIADSHAPLANDLREKIYRMMLEGQSDVQIQAYLVRRYGDFILLKPRFSAHTLLLWLFPFIALLISFFIIQKTLKSTYR